MINIEDRSLTESCTMEAPLDNIAGLEIYIDNTIELEGSSPLTRIIRSAAYSHDYPATQEAFWILHRDIQVALRSEHPEWLYNDSLRFKRGQSAFKATVDMRNTQFIGADRTLSSFKNGYEPDILVALEVFMSENGCFIDIGSNWGYFSFYQALKPGFRGRCIAFEPARRAFSDLELLTRTLELNDVVFPFNYAVMNRDGQFSMTDELWTGNNSVLDCLRDNAGDTYTVNAIQLDSFVSDHSLVNIDLIKIDVEGAEADVLSAAISTIKRETPIVIFENWLDEDEKYKNPFLIIESINTEYIFFTIKINHISSIGHVKYELLNLSPESRSLFEPRINVIAIPMSKLGILSSFC